MASNALKHRVRLREKAKKLYPNDNSMQRKFVNSVLKRAKMKIDNPKETFDMVAQAFNKHG